MRVIVHPADRGGCGHYRMIWPAERLAAAGVDVTVTDDYEYPLAWTNTIHGREALGIVGDQTAFRSLAGAMTGELALGRKRGATGEELARIERRYVAEFRDLAAQTGRAAVDADVVVLQRVVSQDRVELIRALQAIGVAVVVEVDDDLHAIHRRNPAWSSMNPLENPMVNREWLARACDLADMVTVTTPALAHRYASHGRFRIIPNFVPAHYLTVERPAHSEVRVGWSGSTVTHPGDLEVTEGGVAHAIRDTGAALHVVGTGRGVAAALRHDGPVTATEWLPIADYPNALAQLDVGIVPLAPSAFNNAKSWLKGIEMAAVGVPFVASPTDPYRAFERLGFGFVASTVDEWRWQVAELVSQSSYRADLSGRYRDRIAAGFTIEQQLDRWPDAWAAARRNADARMVSCQT